MLGSEYTPFETFKRAQLDGCPKDRPDCWKVVPGGFGDVAGNVACTTDPSPGSFAAFDSTIKVTTTASPDDCKTLKGEDTGDDSVDTSDPPSSSPGAG